MAGWNLEVGAFEVVWTGVVQGIGAGSIIVPLGVVTFATLDQKHRTEAASMWNLVRSAGSGIGISVAVFIVTRMASVNRAGLVEHISPYNSAYRQLDLGGLVAEERLRSFVMLDTMVTRQAELIGYVNVFYLTAWAAFLALPLILLLKRPAPPRPA